MTVSRAVSKALLPAALLLASCANPVFTVRQPGAPLKVDPADSPECVDKDVASFMAGHLEDMQACTDSLGCRKDHVRTVTLLVGCNGPGGALMVLSHTDLKEYNRCMADKAAAWDYSGLCTTEEGECAWTVAVEIECKMQ